MKILIYIIFSFVLIGKIQAQDTTPNKIDDKNVRQGLWTVYYTKNWQETIIKDSVAFYSVGELKDGLWNGVCPDYYAKTNLKKNEITYLNGKASGLAIYYGENEKINSKGKFLDDKKEGLWNWYYPSGKIQEEVTFINGKREGKYKKLSEKGEILEEYVFENDQKQVKTSDWRKNYDMGVADYKGITDYYDKKNYNSALVHFKNALPLAEKEFGTSSSEYAGNINYLAIISQNQQKYEEAEVLYLQAKNIYEKLEGKQTANYMTCCENLVGLYKAQKANAKLEILYGEIRNIMSQKYGGESLEIVLENDKIATFYYNQDNLKQAEFFYLEAKNIYAKIKGVQTEAYANIIIGLGNTYLKQNLYAKAEPLYIEVKNIREKILGKKHPDYAVACNNLGELYGRQDLYTKSIPLFIEAKNIRENVLGKEHAEYAQSCNNLGTTYLNQGQVNKAEILMLESKDIYEKIKDKQPMDYANICFNLGVLYKKQGFYAKAEPLLVEAKNVREKTVGKEHLKYATSLDMLAQLYSNQGNFHKVEMLFTEAKNIREKILGNESVDYAISCNNLALFFEEQGNSDKAILLLKEQKIIFEKIIGKESDHYANACSALGFVYKRKKNYAEAEKLIIEAKEIRGELFGKNHMDYALSCNNLGSLYDTQGLFAKATPLYIEARNIYGEISGKTNERYAVYSSNLAISYESQGLYAKAEPLFIEVNKIYLAQIGRNFAILSEKEKALFYETFSYNFKYFNAFAVKRYKENPAISAEVYSNSLATKALIFSSSNKMRERILNGNDETLKKTFQLWRDKKEHLSKVYTLNLEERKKKNIDVPALEAEANEIEKSLSLKSEFFAKANDNTKYTWKDVQKQLKNDEVIIEIIRFTQAKIIRQFDFIGKGISYIPTNDSNYQIEKIMGENTPAYKAGMRAGDIFVEINGIITKGKTREEIAKLFVPKECTFKVHSITNNIKDTKIKTFVVKADSIFKTKTIYEPSYMALIITPTTQNQPEMVVLSNGKELETDAIAYYKNNIKFKKEDKASYNAFWRDIKAKLGDAKKVYFVPDGVYHQLNLVTLQNPVTKAYLRSEAQVQLLSSSKDLIKYAENAKKQRKNFKDYQIHLFGYPAYAQKNDKISTTKEERSLSFSAKMDTTQRFFNPNSGVITVLEGTKVEVGNISKILTDKKIKVTNYLENQAEEGTIKALKNPDILHIATHGFFLGDTEGFNKENADKFKENPLLRSGLLLKDAEKGLRGEILEGEDGVLTAQEAINLNLDDTELVVMSACETGLGEIKNGEGVYGLQRSFQQAGAKTILMSLWKVDDNATQEVMTLFYNNLVAGKTKRQAFDEAQETLYKKYKNPYFWGAFVMVGE